MGSDQDSHSNNNSNKKGPAKFYNNPVNPNKQRKNCPFCNKEFPYSTPLNINSYLLHEENCRYDYNKKAKSNKNINKNMNKNINKNIQKNIDINSNSNNSNKDSNKKPQMIGSLVLTDSLKQFLSDTKKELPRGKKNGTFEEKVDYLRYDISKKKIDFTDGCETLYITRENVLENSLVQSVILNLFKEIKIIFIGEESSDAGGLIREWLTILFKELLDPKTGLFERSDTDEVSYMINKNISKSEETLNKYFFIGRILAKALLENLTVNCCFNKVIYQLILGEKIQFKDLIFIDKPLYNSLKNLIAMKKEGAGDNIALCEIYFSYQYKDDKGNMCYKELIKNGNNILVTKDNLDLYIQKRIELITNSQLIGVNEIIRGINTIFDANFLKIFTSDQLGLLINGTPFIDVDDWRLNTQYKDYQNYDNVIIDFWEVISNLSQGDLSNFLLFCTGSSRVPIGGFKSLESNRGQISKFEIVKINYIPGAKNFLRVHTCFNRLDLPEYPNKYELEEAIRFALENQVLGYGIE